MVGHIQMALAVQNIEHTILLNNETKIEIDKLKKTSEFDRNGLYLFVSFDLDNSTLFKSKATTNWPNIIMYFIDKEKLGHLPKITDRLKVVALEELKGVWEGRSYPIIWYYPDWDNCEKSFDYDEDIKNEIIKNISGKKNIDFLEKVYEDTGRKGYMKDFIEICKRYNDDGTTELVLGE